MLSALLIWFGTGMQPFWPLMWLAPLPPLLVATRASAQRTAVVAFAAWFLGVLNLWHYLHGLITVPATVILMDSGIMALVFTLAVIVFRALLRRGAYVSALLALPATWVSFEYIVNLTSSSGTAVSLAYSQLRFLPFLQLASLTGPWGMSFLLLSFPAAVAVGVYLYRIAPKRAGWIVGGNVAVIVAVLAFGTVRLLSPIDGPLVKVGLVASDAQGNDDVADKGAPTQRLLQAYADEAAKLAADGAKAIVMPEKIGVVVDGESPASDAVLQATADQTGATVVAGLVHVAPKAEYNAARIYVPHAAPLEYHKEHMLPPFELKFTPGKAITVMSHPSGRWGVAICKDMDFTGLSRRYGNAGAGLMLVPAWDFNMDWLFHGHIALMRGVEDGFSIVRAAKNGSIFVSDNRGRILAEVRTNTAPFVALVTEVPVAHANTLYQRWGNWFAWVALGLLMLVVVQGLRLRKHSGDAA
ncbi:MAG TPA: nitrilase-related carbon-nitrogen hydrolase [Dyella sp.]|uniref:apolipoprotein N-acyltransferase n=1 Tax=Dyella sp. TaxID=1869338 RepID=UPI002C4E48A9|nr:nitrilase-related carbon-nitrogen hydrolase [Dyella sp.]HUB88264.1 nitrilase-related carbon-nitrogen hydrolase [Dyella sp.]